MDSYYQIRKATLDDVDVMVEMQLSMAMETERLTLDRETVKRGVIFPLKNPNVAEYYLAECEVPIENSNKTEKKIIAMLMTTFEWSEWRAGSILWIQSVYVIPQHRRRGVFHLMYKHVKEIVDKSDYLIGIRLYVEENNEQAVATYEKVGLKQEHYRMMKWMKTDF